MSTTASPRLRCPRSKQNGFFLYNFIVIVKVQHGPHAHAAAAVRGDEVLQEGERGDPQQHRQGPRLRGEHGGRRGEAREEQHPDREDQERAQQPPTGGLPFSAHPPLFSALWDV